MSSDSPVPRRSWTLNRENEASCDHDRTAGSNSKNSSMFVAIEPTMAMSIGSSPRTL